MIVALSVLVRFLVLLLLIRLVLRAVASAALARTAPAAPVSGTAAVDLVRDRVCNTFVPRHRAVRGVIAGEEQLFCSPACADRARGLSAPR